MLSRISVLFMRQSKTILFRNGRSVSNQYSVKHEKVQKNTTLQTPDQESNVILWGAMEVILWVAMEGATERVGRRSHP